MAFIGPKGRVLESTTSTGTGAITLLGAITGFRRFSDVCAVGDTFHYFIEAIDSLGNPTGDYEEGLGTYSGVNQITRTAIESSNGGGLVNFTSGTKNVGITLLTTSFQGGSNSNGKWRRHPDGTIEQWGSLTTPAGGTLTQNFPIAFPTGCESLQTSIGALDGSTNGIGWSGLTTTKFDVTTYSSSTGAGKSLPVHWRAIGR